MGRMLDRAIEHAGLKEVAERALSGKGLEPQDLACLTQAEILIVAGLADAVRAQHRGDEVRVLGGDAARREPQLVRLNLGETAETQGRTGEELLRVVALARLQTATTHGIAVSFEQVGLGLAQIALTFGADTLIGDLGSARTLPLLDGKAARRDEIAGLIERAGRRARFVDAQPLAMESRS